MEHEHPLFKPLVIRSGAFKKQFPQMLQHQAHRTAADAAIHLPRLAVVKRGADRKAAQTALFSLAESVVSRHHVGNLPIEYVTKTLAWYEKELRKLARIRNKLGPPPTLAEAKKLRRISCAYIDLKLSLRLEEKIRFIRDQQHYLRKDLQCVNNPEKKDIVALVVLALATRMMTGAYHYPDLAALLWAASRAIESPDGNWNSDAIAKAVRRFVAAASPEEMEAVRLELWSVAAMVFPEVEEDSEGNVKQAAWLKIPTSPGESEPSTHFLFYPNESLWCIMLDVCPPQGQDSDPSLLGNTSAMLSLFAEQTN